MQKFYSKSEGRCENALEVLQGLMHHEGSLRVWCHGSISFEVGGGLGADIDVKIPITVNNDRAST